MEKTIAIIILTLVFLSAHASADTNIPEEFQSIISNFKNKNGGSPWGTINAAAPITVKQFGRLSGLWRMETKTMDQKGNWQKGNVSYWAWKYILDGHAVQDLYMQEQDSGPSTKITQLRHFDLKDSQWHVAWINTLNTRHGRFFATLKDGEMVMVDPEKSPLETPRIVFKDIEENSFVWEYRIYQNSKNKWLTVSVFNGTKIE